MKIAKQARREATQLFRSCLGNGLLDEERARQTVKKVLELKPRGYLQILAHFQRLVTLDVEAHAARVESAEALSNDLQARLRENLLKTYGQGLTVSFAQNPALIGGLRIRVGSDVYDGTIQGRLSALQESFETI